MHKSTQIPDRYAVLGNPIGHSLSPTIHAAFAAQTNQYITYEKILVPLDGFTQTVGEFQQHGGRGVNVTLPFKEQAWQLADWIDPTAVRSRSVNVLKFLENGSIEAYSTDGLGLLRDLKDNHHQELINKRILLLGAGGAARAVLTTIAAQMPALFVIANRTATKAKQLAHEFADLGELQGCGFDDLAKWQFDIIINATSASLSDEELALPHGIIEPQGCCYDMAYGKKQLPFLTWAKQQGVKNCVDGIGMLVEQAAESFYIWRNVRPEAQVVIETIRSGNL